MAMSYHMEARIKQDRLNRWHEQKVRADAGPSNQGLNDRLDEMIYKEKMDRVVTTDPGQFNQISETGEKRFKNWNPPKKERPKESVPRPPPASVLSLKRDRVHTILHPYDFH